MFNGEAFASELVSVVKDAIGRAVATLRAENAELAARNAALEARLEAVEARDVVAELRPQIEAVARAVDALPGAPDLSGFATKADVDAVREAIPAIPEAPDLSGFATKADVDEVRSAIPSVPDAPDLSGFATKDELGQAVGAVREAIPVLPEPADLSGFATKDEVAAEVECVRAAIPEPADLSGFATKDDVAGVLAAIPVVPEAPDLSGLATKEDVAAVRAEIPAVPEPADLTGFAMKAEVDAALAAIIIPEAINGEDADPAEAAQIVLGLIEDQLADVDRRVTERLAEVKDGKDGVLPLAEEWSDRVHRRAEIVTHNGSLWQARQDTGKEPPHGDWLCLARAGRDGLTPEFVGTYDPDAEVRRLDVVALNGGSFVALRDNPGPCPGEGWQLLAGRGKPGPSVKGDPGKKGDPGVEPVGLYRDGDEIVLTLADGREYRA